LKKKRTPVFIITQYHDVRSMILGGEHITMEDNRSHIRSSVFFALSCQRTPPGGAAGANRSA